MNGLLKSLGPKKKKKCQFESVLYKIRMWQLTTSLSSSAGDSSAITWTSFTGPNPRWKLLSALDLLQPLVLYMAEIKLNFVCTYHIPLENKPFRFPLKCFWFLQLLHPLTATAGLTNSYSVFVNPQFECPPFFVPSGQKSLPSHAWVGVHAVDEIVNLAVVLPVVALVGLLDKHEHRDQKQERSTDQHGKQKGRIGQLPAQGTAQYFYHGGCCL